jgi:hypothetical protein
VVDDLALDPRAGDEVVHPVQAADERRLAAARGPDQRRDLMLGDPQRDVADRAVPAVEHVDCPRVEDRLGRGRTAWDRRLDGGVGLDGALHGVITTSAHSGS